MKKKRLQRKKEKEREKEVVAAVVGLVEGRRRKFWRRKSLGSLEGRL